MDSSIKIQLSYFLQQFDARVMPRAELQHLQPLFYFRGISKGLLILVIGSVLRKKIFDTFLAAKSERMSFPAGKLQHVHVHLVMAEHQQGSAISDVYKL